MRQTPCYLSAVVVLLGLAGGCDPPQRMRFPHEKIRLEIGEQALTVEIACDDLSRTLGLMNRDSLPEDQGMLFVFARAQSLSFWMKDTRIPLSIAFLSDEGEILQIEDMKPLDERSTVSDKHGRYALEVNQGWFQRHGLGVGSRIRDLGTKLSRFEAR